MSDEIDAVGIAAELLGIKSWLEFYGKDFFPKELYNDLCSKLGHYADIALKNEEMTEYRAFYALQILLRDKTDFQAIREAFEVLHDFFLFRTGKIRERDFLRAVDRLEGLISKRGLLRRAVSEEEKDEFRKALEAFDLKKSVKEALNELS
jgi:hypothetical protein